jgi:hypothetical protein
MLEKRKSGFWLISVRTIFLLAGAVLAAVSIPVDSLQLITGMLGISAYLMLIFTLAAVWEGDLSLHYIYLIPEAPVKKMLSSTLPEVIKIFIEGTLIFGIVGVILRISFWVALAAILAYSTLGAVFVYSDLVVRRLFGKIHGNILRIFFRIILLIIIISSAVTLAVLVFMSTNSQALALFMISVINTVLVILFMFIGVGLFKSPELT